MSVPQDLLALMQRFRDNERHYRDAAYNETETRRELIDPFFKALGWDVDNTRGFSEKYKEVVHEARVKVGRATKAPDYAFRVGGQPIFFVEAKKPAVRLADDPDPAYQVRRYAWSAKLPVSILTNFAEFALYDCRFKPAHSDHPATARVLYFTYEEYPDRWAELAALLSPQAVRKGALDRFVESTKSKRGTQAVDDAFLAEIEGWREALARNFALRNPLPVRQLNFAVQKTIDRIIFLRIAEDRGFEPYHRLGDVAATGGDLYRQLGELFRQADNRYNAGLFYFEPEDEREDNVDDFTLDLRLDDRVLKEIIGDLYYPESPYAFDALPADILGQVYERFLGSVIRLTPSGRAKVEEKPEVKKAGGVYYTPTYIVDYIVAHTVGRLVEDRSWRAVRGLDARGARRYAPLRVVDPACGSGTFLLQAYQFLLDWYLAQYVDGDKDGDEDVDAEAHARAGRLRAIIGGGAESWRLTTEERKEILLTHIYGVDIDPQAVEVAKLSLLLKVLEGEDAESLGAQLTMSLAGEARVLPDLTANIRCGNSLIGSDFYQGEQLSLGLVDEETMYRINAFDWEGPHGFPQAMAAGGFDAVIGNPPYIRIQALKQWAPQEVEFYKQRYRAARKGNYDIYVVFVEKGLGLLKPGGRLGYILPSKFFTTDYGASLRALLSELQVVDQVVDFEHNQVFSGATTYTCLLFLDKSQPEEVQYIDVKPENLSNHHKPPQVIPAESLTDETWLFLGRWGQDLLEKLNDVGRSLLELPATMSRGTSTGADKIYCLAIEGDEGDKLITRDGERVDIEPGILRTPLRATDFSRYAFDPQTQERIIFPYTVTPDGYDLIAEQELRSKWPKAYDYLRANRQALRQRKQYKEWYAFSAPRNLNLHDQADLLVPLLADRGLYTPAPDNRTEFCLMASGGFSIGFPATDDPLNPLYVLGVLNSQLLFWNLRVLSNKFRGGWITCTKQYFGQLPIRAIDFSDPDDVARHDRMVALVERMLELHARLAEAKTPQAKRLLQQQIAVTDRAIDDLVYVLYGLTAEEIAAAAGA